MHGSWGGRLVSLVGSVEDLALLARHRSSMENPQYETYLVQEFIKKPGRDIRVTVVGDEAVAAIYRYAVSNDWRTNTARGGKAEGVRIDPELEDISVRQPRQSVLTMLVLMLLSLTVVIRSSRSTRCLSSRMYKGSPALMWLGG